MVSVYRNAAPKESFVPLLERKRSRRAARQKGDAPAEAPLELPSATDHQPRKPAIVGVDRFEKSTTCTPSRPPTYARDPRTARHCDRPLVPTAPIFIALRGFVTSKSSTRPMSLSRTTAVAGDGGAGAEIPIKGEHQRCEVHMRCARCSSPLLSARCLQKRQAGSHTRDGAGRRGNPP